jgi:hypothetical protein
MKVAVRALSALAAVAILAGSMGSPVLAKGKKAKTEAEPTIVDWIDSDLKSIDKALTDLFAPPKK